MNASAFVSALTIYPVKSARPISVSTAAVGTRGLVGDREWMLVDERGRFVSQRTLSRMAQLQVTSHPEGVCLTAPGGPSCRVDTPRQGDWLTVDVWGDIVQARDAGEFAARYLTEVFARPLRLVWMPPNTLRPADPQYAGRADVPVSFADGFPVLVASAASLDELNRRLPAPIQMARFRPNVVISGWEAFAEDHIRRIRCGEIELDLVKPCTRCVITSLDPLTGETASDPTSVLKSFRFDPTLRGVTFGVNAIVSRGMGASLEVGTPVEVLG